MSFLLKQLILLTFMLVSRQIRKYGSGYDYEAGPHGIGNFSIVAYTAYTEKRPLFNFLNNSVKN